MTEYDPYNTTSGLEDVDYTFKGVTFAFDAEYNEGQTLLLIVEDGTQTDEDDHVTEERKMFTVGDKWEPTSNGESCQHESGKPKNYQAKSGVGLLLDSIKDTPGIEVMQGRGSPMDAATWEGLIFRLHNKQFSFKNSDGEVIEYGRWIAMEFLGEGKKKPKKRVTKKVAAKTADDDGDGEGEGDIPKALSIKLNRLAKAAETYDDFLEKAFDVDGVDGNEEVEDALEGIWEANES